MKIISLSMEQEKHNLLKAAAKEKGCSVSELVRKLTDYIELIVNDGQEIPVILKIPAELKGNEEELRKWLSTRNEAIVKALCPKK